MSRNASLDAKERQARSQRLQVLYGVLVQLLTGEAELVSARTNNFLTFNSILFAGYLILASQGRPSGGAALVMLKVVVPLAGVLFCALHSVSILRTMEAADFWRSTIGLVEDDPDFWIPRDEGRDSDLDVFNAKRRHSEGETTRQAGSTLRNKETQLAPAAKRFSRLFPTPDQINIYFVPLMIALVWAVGFLWAVVSV